MSLEFAFLCGEKSESVLNHVFDSHISAECLHNVSLQPPSLPHRFSPRLLECSHLLMDAVISLGSRKFQSHLDFSGGIIHLEWLPLCLQTQSVSLMHYPTSEWERLEIDFQ